MENINRSDVDSPFEWGSYEMHYSSLGGCGLGMVYPFRIRPGIVYYIPACDSGISLLYPIHCTDADKEGMAYLQIRDDLMLSSGYIRRLDVNVNRVMVKPNNTDRWNDFLVWKRS